MCMLSYFSHVWLFATPWTVALQAPQSMGFSRKEYWSGLQCSPTGGLPHPEIEPASLSSPALAVGSVSLVPPGEAWWIDVNICLLLSTHIGLPRWLSDKESVCQAGHTGSIAQMGRSPGEGHGNPLLYSCLGNSMDRGTWPATVYRVSEWHDWSNWAHTQALTWIVSYNWRHKEI